MAAEPGDAGSEPGGGRLFTDPLTYRAILAVRHFLVDIAVAALFAGCVVVWEVVVNTASPAHVQVLISTGTVAWWTNDAMIPVMPAFVAAAVFLMGLRIGARMVDDESLRGVISGYGGQLVLYGIVLLSAWDAISQLPGSLVSRYVPLAAAVYLAVRVRRHRSRGPGGRLRVASSAGFTPSRRAMVLPRGRTWLDSVAKAYPAGLAATTNIAETTMWEAAKYFLRRFDARTAAYCMARGIDYLLAHGQLADAEKAVRALGEEPRYGAQPAARAARAMLLQAVGRRTEAHAQLLEAERLARRVPPALHGLLLASGFDLDPAAPRVPWTVRARFAAVWRRRVTAVVLSSLLEARANAERHPGYALDLAYRAAGLPEALLAELRRDDIGHDLRDFAAVRGLAFEIAGKVAADRGEFAEAAEAYLDAFDELCKTMILGRGQHARAARCATFAFIYWVRAGYDGPDEQHAALDAIRSGLEILEHSRGLLRETEDRAQYIAEQGEMIAAVFDLLTTQITYPRAKAGELGVWLLESLHRSLTADLLATDSGADWQIEAQLAELHLREAQVRLRGLAGAMSATDREDLAQLGRAIDDLLATRLRTSTPVPDQVAIEELCELLDGRAALIYQCSTNREGHWRINAALVAPRRQMRVHTVVLPAAGLDPEVAAWFEPAGVLNLLAAGEPGGVQDVYSTPADDPVWKELSSALLPETWQQELWAPDASSTELVIVPDGPLAHFPFGALPIGGGRLLLESAAVTLAPSLGLLRPRNHTPRGQGPLSVVTHMDDLTLAGGSIELESWRSRPRDQVHVIETSTREQLEQQLAAPHRPDVVSISVHGTGDGGYGAAAGFGQFVRLRDETILSTRAALNLTWPKIVLLGACWIGGVELSVGREPGGFPIACLQNGAETVLGGAASIPDGSSAWLLAQLTRYLPDLAPAYALRQAQLDLARTTQLSEQPPIVFAGLCCWSLAPAATPAADTRYRPWWSTEGAAVGELSNPRTFDADLLGHALQRVLAHAAQQASDHPVTTFDLLRSAFAADDVDWGSFLLAAGLTPPASTGPDAEGAEGVVRVLGAELDVLVSAPTAGALRRALRVCEALRDETVQTAHAVYAALLEPGSSAAHWIATGRSPGSAAWQQHLGNLIFRTDLPNLDQFHPRTAETITQHACRAKATRLSDTAARHRVSGRTWENKFTAALLVVLLAFSCDTDNLAIRLQTYLYGRGALGAVVVDAPGGGALIEGVVPGSSAAAARIEPGEVLYAVGGTETRTADDAINAISGYTRGATVELTLTRDGRATRTPVRIEPLSINPTPGSLGVELDGTSGRVVIAKIDPGGPAQSAGITQHDVITAIDGVRVEDSVAAVAYLIHYRDPGATVVLTIDRAGKTVTIAAVLGR